MPAYEPMNAAELMDRVFDVYKKSFVKQLAFSALVGVVSFVVMMVVGIAAAMAAVMPYIYEPEAVMTSVIITMLAVMLPIYWIWTATANAGHILLSQQAFYDRRPRVPVRQLPGVTLRVLSASLMQLLLSFPWILLMVLFAWLALRSTGAIDISDTTSLMLMFSSNAWVVISIIGTLVYVAYSNLFALAVPVAVFEKRVFHQTIVRSYWLMKGEYWKILGLRILWSAVVYLFSYSAQGLWAVLAMLLGSVSGGSSVGSVMMVTLGTLLQSLFTIAVSFIIGPLSGILTALLYFNQRIKKEGLDMEIMLERLHDQL